MFPATLFAVLLVYLKEDALEPDLAALSDLRALFQQLPQEEPPAAVTAKLLHAAALQGLELLEAVDVMSYELAVNRYLYGVEAELLTLGAVPAARAAKASASTTGPSYASAGIW